MNPDFYTQINDHLSVMAKSNIIRHIKAKSYYSIHRFRSTIKVFLQSGKDRVHQIGEFGRRYTAYSGVFLSCLSAAGCLLIFHLLSLYSMYDERVSVCLRRDL